MTGEREPIGAARSSASEDAILKAGPGAASGENVRCAASTTEPSPDTDDPEEIGWGWRVPGDRDARGRGWLPGAQALTLGEVLAGMVAAVFVCFVGAFSLALAQDVWNLLPEPVTSNQELASRLCGLAGGLWVTVRLRGSRLARRAHLRGER